MKKYRTAIIIFIVVVIILLLIVLLWNKIFPPKDEKQEQQESQQEADQSNVSITLQEGSFPLTVKDKNLKVQRVQQALIKMGCSIPAGATGYFGSQTQAALKCAGYDDSKITESDYNDILALKKKASFNAGSQPVATKSGGPIMDYYDHSKIVLYTSAGSSNGCVIKIVGADYLALGDCGSLTPKYYVNKTYYS